ncbi:PilN domain-containing protein [uncultured Paludibaculum sp.]|uniref:PilN domain-containing protein n=1 Tax=uncultured Paludibaculum sp. TaxID=1765020 RepID=UPI002AAB775A|nr:PilN domain-containing protein [uncultured Paludibaculum sp.]
MAQLKSPLLRSLFRFGTGAGIVIGADSLTVYLARVRPGGARLLDTLTIGGFRQRPASEWGAEYAAFLQKHSLQHLSAIAVLPRNEVVVRLVRLPGVADDDAAAAIRFQLDTLHPFPEDEVVYDFQRAGSADGFVVAIAERRILDFYTALFAEAGLKTAGFTFSGGAVFPSLRLFGVPPAEGFLAVHGLLAGAEAPFELYGESSAYPLFSAELDVPLDRAGALAAAELRLPAETEPRDLAELLPVWQSAPDNQDFSDAGRSRAALPWAASLAAACPRLGTPLNLLPLEQRVVSSRAAYIPTIFLLVVLACVTGALLARNAMMDRKYGEQLQAEIKRLEPTAAKVAALDLKIADESERIRDLDGYRLRTKESLDIVLEFTKMLPPPAWIQSLQIDPKAVVIQGETEQADGLLKKLDASPHFAGSEFTAPLSRTPGGELFRVRANREGAK